MTNQLPLRWLVAGILLFIVSAPIIGLLIYQVQVCYNRFEMLERLEAERLHVITIPADDVHWRIPGIEVKIKDKLFDVKEYTANGPAITFIGIFDDEEEELEKKISNQSLPGDNKLPFLLKLTFSPAIASGAISIISTNATRQKPSPNIFASALAFFAHAPAGPPPRSTC